MSTERLDTAPNPAAEYEFALFVGGASELAVEAITNARRVLEANLRGRYSLVCVDVYQHPELVGADQVVVTPTLLRRRPLPARRIVGSLFDADRVVRELDLRGEQTRTDASSEA